MYPATFGRDLSFTLNDTHGDLGVANFAYVTGADLYALGWTKRRRPLWVGIDMVRQRTRANGWKLMLQGLSRNPQGVGVLNVFCTDSVVCDWAQMKSHCEVLVDLFEVPKRFGDLYRSIDRADEIAVVSSFREQFLGSESFRELWNAPYLVQKADYQAHVISDMYCEANPEDLAKHYKAIFLFQIEHGLSEPMQKAMESFQAAGGLVIVDAASKVDLPNVVRLPFAVPKDGGPSNANDHLLYERMMKPYVEQFREAVAPHLQPFFGTEGMDYSCIRSTDGELEYWIAWSDKKPFQDVAIDPESQDYSVWVSPGTQAQFLYAGSKTRFTAPAEGVLYDGLRRTRVETEAGPDGRMAWELDLTHHPGTIYLLAPRPVAALEVGCSPRVAPGGRITLAARALDEAGTAFEGRLPVEVLVTDPEGAERYRLYRTTNQPVTVKIAGNDPAGTWQCRFADQATGLEATCSFEVEGTTQPPALEANADLVCDAPVVHDFLHGREVEVALWHTQVDLEPKARKLVTALNAAGVNARLRVLLPGDLLDFPMQWQTWTIEDEAIDEAVKTGRVVGRRVKGKNHFGDTRVDQFGTYAYYNEYGASQRLVYYKDVILLGRDGDLRMHPLLSEVERCQMLWRRLSPNLPAAGQGLVAYAWSPFHYGHDAVVVYGRGEAGLDQAIDQVIALAERPERSAPAYRPTVGRLGFENGERYAELGLAAPAPPAFVQSDARQVTSLLPRTFTHRVQSVALDAAGQLCIGMEPQMDKETAPDLARVDPERGAAAQYRLAERHERRDAEALAWHFGADGRQTFWPPSDGEAVEDDVLCDADGGLGRFASDGSPEWWYEVFDPRGGFAQAKYYRRNQGFAVSDDGARVLGAFYNLTQRAQDMYQLGPGVLSLLDAKTGEVITRVERYTGSRIRIGAAGQRFAALDLRETNHFHSHDDRYSSATHLTAAWIWNPHNTKGLVVFDDRGRELCFQPVRTPVDRFCVDDGVNLALLSYDDARRKVSLMAVADQAHQHLGYPRVDAGIAVAPAGRFVVVTYEDGAVCRYDTDGVRAWTARLSAPGLPLVDGEGRILVACHDRIVHVLEPEEGTVVATHAFADAAAGPLDPEPFDLPEGVAPPQPTPFWQALEGDFDVEPLDGASASALAVAPEAAVEVTVPNLAKLETLLVAFRYRLARPGDELRATATLGGKERTFRFPYALEARWAWVPVRGEESGPLSVRLACAESAEVTDVRPVRLRAADMRNGVFSPKPGKRSNGIKGAQAPRVLIPNFFGMLGDSRCEQTVYGFKMDGGRGNPDVRIPEEYLDERSTDPWSYFDGDVYHGTPLYPAMYRKHNLRSAEIIMVFREPRTFSAIGVWEDPRERPVDSFALEVCDSYEIAQKTDIFVGDWRPVYHHRRNTQYYHVHAFPATTGKVWRYTVLRTPAHVQRCAEIELYESAVDALEADMDIDGIGGGIGDDGLMLEE